MKKIFLALFITGGVFANAQTNEHRLYGKVNALFLPVGMLNAGLEYQLSPKITLEADGFMSPWKSFAGNHAQVYMAHLEGRYYFNEAFKHWYVGANTGFGVFDLTKWNYRGSDKFQRGFTFMLGATVGYQFQINDKLNLDVFVGGGTAQSSYHGYESVPPDGFVRYDKAKEWNKSGEIVPYRIGVMLSYKLK